GSEGARGGEIAGALVCRGLLPLQYPRPKVHPGSQREHYGGRPGERQSYTPPQADRGLPVTRAERRSRAVWGGGQPEQLICARDECPLFLQAAAAAGALCDLCLDVLGLERRELAVERGAHLRVFAFPVQRLVRRRSARRWLTLQECEVAPLPRRAPRVVARHVCRHDEQPAARVCGLVDERPRERLLGEVLRTRRVPH